jgi:mycothiol synthase
LTLRSRPYVDEDLPRLQGALAVWIRQAGACGYCHAAELAHRIYEDLRGRRPVGELVQVWEDGAAIAGVAVNLRFGSAFDVYTSPSRRGTPHEREMVQYAFETTARYLRGAPVVTDVFGCDTAKAETLRGLGFAEYRLWDHIRERSLLQPIPDPQWPPGFCVRTATMEDHMQLAAVRNSSFGEDWSGEAYLAEVMLKPGYRPERELIVLSPEGQVVAFTVTWLDGLNRVGHFEPVGTHRNFQRRGLARAMMLHALHELRTLGMESATVEHTADNLAALALYRGLGFEKTYETFGYRR